MTQWGVTGYLAMVLVSECDIVKGCDTVKTETLLPVLANGCDAMRAVRNCVRWISTCGCAIVGAEKLFQESLGRRM